VVQDHFLTWDMYTRFHCSGSHHVHPPLHAWKPAPRARAFLHATLFVCAPTIVLSACVCHCLALGSPHRVEAGHTRGALGIGGIDTRSLDGHHPRCPKLDAHTSPPTRGASTPRTVTWFACSSSFVFTRHLHARAHHSPLPLHTLGMNPLRVATRRSCCSPSPNPPPTPITIRTPPLQVPTNPPTHAPARASITSQIRRAWAHHVSKGTRRLCLRMAEQV
jgi:hypothetical protein